MSQVRIFSCPPARLSGLIGSVQQWLRGENFTCQTLSMEDGGTLLQVEKNGGWRKFVGMSTTLNVVFRGTGDSVKVEIGSGRWIDKAVVGTVSLFVLWPLAVTSVIGSWQQAKMPNRVFDHIDRWLSRPVG